MAYTLRKLGEDGLASEMVRRSFSVDPLNFTGYMEKLELSEEKEALVEKMHFLFDRRDPLFIGSQIYIETAIHYMELGDYALARKVLDMAEQHFQPEGRIYPFITYYKGFCLLKSGHEADALAHYKRASASDPTYVFPYRRESLAVLESVLTHHPGDALARMYYGDLLYYLRRHDEALEAWERSHQMDPRNFRVSRNLAIGRYVRSGDAEQATRLLEKAFEQSGKDPRIFAELEALYISQRRIDKLENHYDDNLEILHRKGDYALRATDFYIRRERYRDASTMLMEAYFSPAERALGKPVRHTRYVEAQIGLAQELLDQQAYPSAIDVLKKAYEHPGYLNEARVNRPVTARLDFHLAMAYKQNKQKDLAEEFFRRAIEQEMDPFSVAAIFKARALEETGKKKEAEKLARDIVTDPERPGSGSGIDDYIRSLAHAFLGEKEKAAELLQLAFEKDFNVDMNARYASSYLPKQKFALE
jgi:tetratricopeptide (TPR) repeat protein